jgi:hypothetical protein
MYEYRQVIYCKRTGQSDRTIAKGGLIGRLECAHVREAAKRHGWVDDTVPLPDDQQLAQALGSENDPNRSQQSLSLVHEAAHVGKWFEEGIWTMSIYQTLVDQFGFGGSYSPVRHLVQKIRSQNPKVTCILDSGPSEVAQVDFAKGPMIADAFTGEVIST